ncbi:hypothetical protein CK203_035180 [Vitis vinifera]|uniref:Uncharacterized protein n=1 Tax=Vitis vinifera TaxID=29760 RepID=A0A438HAJ7_VITVI|nr:hypothetical protein CK203_035180 [Vitis vinifera]
MATETPAVPVMVPDEVAPGETHPAVNVEAPNPEQESPSVASSGLRISAQNSEDQLRLRLAEAKPAYPPLGEDNEPSGRIWLRLRAGRNQQSPPVEAEDEMARLRGEVRQLRTEASIEKKQKEDLQLRLTAQKEELERSLLQRGRLEADYQKQVDDTFIFGYRCCMKKNGIKRDVPSIPPGEEKKLLDKPAP